MLELRSYEKDEIARILGTNTTQGIKRKLDRYGVLYTSEGRDNNLRITITDITNPFKVYAITELGVGGNTDFRKLTCFYYHLLNDDVFISMPDEVKEGWMERSGHKVSRQTIANYTEKLLNKNLLYRDTSEFIYYFADGDIQIMTDRATYGKAWREHWNRIDEGYPSYVSINKMKQEYGGVARKQAVIIKNGIFLNEIEYINQLVFAEFQNLIKNEA